MEIEQSESFITTIFKNNKSLQCTIKKEICDLYDLEKGDMIRVKIEKVLMKEKDKKKKKNSK